MVMSYSGYDIEDAVVLNKAALDRGFGRCQLIKRYTESLKTFDDQTMERLVTPTTEPGKARTVDLDGICLPGTPLNNGDIMVNKETPVVSEAAKLSSATPVADSYKLHVSRFKGPETVFVDKVLISSNQDEPFIIKVLTRHTRRPELGDKFSSRHGQKGVVGNIVNEEDMPFNEYVRLLSFPLLLFSFSFFFIYLFSKLLGKRE